MNVNNSLPVDMTNKGQYQNLLDGYIRFYNSDELTSILSQHQSLLVVGIPFAITVFGEILLWKDERYIVSLDIIKNRVQVIAPSYNCFIEFLQENTYIQQYFSIDLYKSTKQNLGTVNIDECYGTIPFIVASNKDVNSWKVVKWKEYLEIILQFVTK